MARKILMTACDAGSANFLLPVLKGLDVPFALYAQDRAAEIFSKNNIPHERLERGGWDQLPTLGDRVLSTGEYGAVLTGTSWGASVDKAATLAARKRGIPAAAIIEHWDLYRERFSRVEDGRITVPDAYLPGSVWLPDARAVEEAEKAGLPRAALKAVGQPHLEAQAKFLGEAGDVVRNRDVVFVSERVGGDFHRGFTEHDALETLISAMDFSRHRLVIKLHPQEEINKYEHLAARGVKAFVVKDCDLRALLLGSHRVVGMFSMLLLEAALIRRDVISLLPGGDPGIFVGNRIGATTPARGLDELKRLLAEDRPSGDAFGGAFAGSRDKVVGLIKEMAE